jgi:hypothetical protein
MGEDVRITVVATGFDGRDKAPIRTRERKEKEEEHRSFFSGTRQFYSLKKSGEEDREEIEEKKIEPRRSGFVTKSVFNPGLDLDGSDDDRNLNQIVNQTVVQPKKIAPPKHDDDADLEIPAFIRRKMGL